MGPMDRLTLRHIRGAPGIAADFSEELAAFYRRFVDCPKPAFLAALRLADELYLLRNKAEELVGFAALRTVETTVEERPAHVLYVLYIDLDPSVRGRGIIERIGLARYLSYRMRHPVGRTFVMFSASTVMSYLLMARNFATFWPTHDRPMPPAIAALLSNVAQTLGLAGWDPQAGVLHRHGVLRYREGVASAPLLPTADPRTRFYVARNPGQTQGDSLLCVFPVTVGNAAAVLVRVLPRWRWLARARRVL